MYDNFGQISDNSDGFDDVNNSVKNFSFINYHTKSINILCYKIGRFLIKDCHKHKMGIA